MRRSWTVGLSIAAFACWEDERPTHTVVRGDTLTRIGQRYGVSVRELQEWNGLKGDLIEVGQQLVVAPSGAGIHPDPVPDRPKRQKKRNTKKAPQGGKASDAWGAGLTRPAAKACIDGPSDAVEQGTEAGFAASKGLSESQLNQALRRAEGNLVRCLSLTDGHTGVVPVALTVACDGRVTAARILNLGPMSEEFGGCVSTVLSYASFPAHDIADGFTFEYPVRVE